MPCLAKAHSQVRPIHLLHPYLLYVHHAHSLLLCTVPPPSHHHPYQPPLGVDISRTRLAICRQVLIKYSIGRPPISPRKDEQPLSQSLWCRLICTDGQSFCTRPDDAWKGSEGDIVFDSRAYDWQVSRYCCISILLPGDC